MLLTMLFFANPLTAQSLKMHCVQKSLTYVVAFNTDRLKLYSDSPALNGRLRVERAKMNALSGDWIVWALLRTVGGASRDVLFSFGHDNWIKHFWANGSMSRVECDAVD